MKKLILKSVLAWTLVMTSNAFSWGPMGHKIVGQIAEQHLTESAKKQVRKLLSNQTLPDVSQWADIIKNEPQWVKTKPWHFVSIEDQETYAESIKNPEGDVIVAIAENIKTLKGNGSQEDKVNALKFLVHFVGDVHQPLHVGRTDDRGGNEIRVTFFSKSGNLHQVWDTSMIDYQGMGVVEYATTLSNNNQKTLNAELSKEFDYNQVVAENISVRTQVYGFENPNLGDDYFKSNLTILNKRLYLGGIRLAKILNSVF